MSYERIKFTLLRVVLFVNSQLNKQAFPRIAKDRFVLSKRHLCIIELDKLTLVILQSLKMHL